MDFLGERIKMKKIKVDKLREFERDFFSGKFPNQRYGQAFCNHFDIKSPEIFYEEDYKSAKMKIWFNFAEFDESILGDDS